MNLDSGRQKPDWFNRKIDLVGNRDMKKRLRELNVRTVCESASCPNISECFRKNTATFIIMGDICTRGCRFCGVTKGKPLDLDSDEPKNIAKMINILGLKYVVLTCVTRDDLEDGGANHFASVIRSIRETKKDIQIEVLTSDFYNSFQTENMLKFWIKILLDNRVDVYGHNIETVKRLYSKLRVVSDYDRSLRVLRYVKDLDETSITKSGIMLGLGEEEHEILKTLKDLREVGCDILTIGQYLAPSRDHYSVKRYPDPKEFKRLKDMAYDLGFAAVESGPYVRSSYKAKETLNGEFL